MPSAAVVLQNRLAKLPVEFLSAVVDALPVGALIMDADWSILAANQSAERFFGYSEAELQELSVDELIPVELRDRYRARRVDALSHPDSQGVVLREERVVRTKDGREVPLDVTIARVHVGESVFLLSTLIDASARTETEQQTIEQLYSIFEHAEQGIFLVRVAPDGTFTFESFNAVTERLTGFTREQARGRTPDQIVAGEEGLRVIANYQRCVEAGAPITYEEAPGAVAGYRVFRTTLVPVRDGDGRVHRILGLARDITDQKQAQSELERTRRTLEESEERFRAAFRVSPHPIGITQVNSGRLIEINDAFVRLFGYSREEAIGKSTIALGLWRNPNDRQRMLAALAHGRMQDLEVEGTSKQGERLEASLSADMAVLDGEPCIITYVLDLTSRRAAERAKAELEDQLRHAQKMDALGTLAGGIAHDFNNILAGIVAYSELIRLDVNDPEAIEGHLKYLTQASDRARDLVGQILTFSRQQPRVRKPTRIDASVRDALNLLRSTLPKTIGIDVSIDPEAPLVLADATEIHQIIMNLGTNAAHAIAPKSGRISVELEGVDVDAATAEASSDLHARRYARLRVRDDGAGMSPSVLEHVFEPFFTTKAPGKGTGLGLSVVHGIVTEHDGAIRVRSEAGRGTEFELYFPECSPEVIEAPSSAAAPVNVAGASILFVDDEMILCRSVSRLLERLGFVVSALSDPAEAVALFRANPRRFDVVLTDLNMPGMTGIDVAREIHAVDSAKPVLVMSGFQGSYTVENLKSLGIVDLVQKPLSTEQLLECLKRALRGSVAPEAGDG